MCSYPPDQVAAERRHRANCAANSPAQSSAVSCMLVRLTHGRPRRVAMLVSTFVQDLNRRHFDGQLSAATVERLEAMPDRDDARAFVERAGALMQRAGMPAQDFSP